MVAVRLAAIVSRPPLVIGETREPLAGKQLFSVGAWHECAFPVWAQVPDDFLNRIRDLPSVAKPTFAANGVDDEPPVVVIPATEVFRFRFDVRSPLIDTDHFEAGHMDEAVTPESAANFRSGRSHDNIATRSGLNHE